MSESLLPTKHAAEPARTGRVLAPLAGLPAVLSRLRGEFDRLFDCVARGWPSLAECAGWRWGLDVQDEENAGVVRAETHGFEPGDFDVQVQDNRLVLRATAKAETDAKEGAIANGSGGSVTSP